MGPSLPALLRNLFDAPPRDGVVAVYDSQPLPAIPDIAARVEPIVTLPAGIEMGIVFPSDVPPVLGYRFRAREGEAEFRGTFSDAARREVLADCRRQVEEYGQIVRLPDLLTIEDSE